MIVGPAMRDAAAARGAAIVCADPYLAFARLTQWWAARHAARAGRRACTRRRWSSPARASTPRPPSVRWPSSAAVRASAQRPWSGAQCHVGRGRRGRRGHRAQAARDAGRGLPHRRARHRAQRRGDRCRRLRLRAHRGPLGEDRAARRRAHRRRRRDRRQHLHRPRRARRHRDRGRRQARQPGADRRTTCTSVRTAPWPAASGVAGSATHRPPLHGRRRRHHPGAPGDRRPRAHHGGHRRLALDPQAGPVQRRVSLRRQCVLGEERRHAAAAARAARRGCARWRRKS